MSKICLYAPYQSHFSEQLRVDENIVTKWSNVFKLCHFGISHFIDSFVNSPIDKSLVKSAKYQYTNINRKTTFVFSSAD